MSNYIVRKPTQEDVEYLIEHVRPEDKAELDALDGRSIRSALDQTPDLLNTSNVWIMDEKPLALFGIVRLPGPMSVGIIWLLATVDFKKYAKKFARYQREVFAKMIRGYGYLFNYVHAENKMSIEWLKWLGFKINEGQPLGHQGAIFHKFEMRNV